MSTLNRYRKKGGFLQLVKLLESCGETKKDKLISMVELEDVRWADAIKKKMLEIEQIVEWPQDILREIYSVVPNRFIAAALHGFPEEYQNGTFELLSRKDQLEVEDIFDAKEPNESEVFAGFIKILEVVRQLNENRRIRFEDFAPNLVIMDGIEEEIESGASRQVDLSYKGKPVDVNEVLEKQKAPGEVVSAQQSLLQKNGGEIEVLKKVATGLKSENEALKTEVRQLKRKLEEIKKLVA